MEVSAANKQHYDRVYTNVNIDRIVQKVCKVGEYLDRAIATDTSWHGMYFGGLRERLGGLRVLELGAGNGLNTLIMAALGATVVAVDISEMTPVIVEKAAARLGLAARVSALCGDFLTCYSTRPREFDLVVGKAFLHHLDHDLEAQFLKKTAALLKADGEARFVEPAVNSRLLDRLRWVMPVPGRPSCISRRAFQAYKDSDPHPVRDNSSAHFREAARKEFGEVEIVCFGGLERLHRLLPKGPWNSAFRRAAFRAEKLTPKRWNEWIARSQLIVCRKPL